MENYTPRLLGKYNSEAKNLLKDKLNITNVMRLPKLSKIVLNMGLGNAKEDKNSLKQALEELTIITGQKAILTKSKKAISNFKIREGDPVGVSVTLRKTMMYEFLDRFISVAAPRIRDFRGLASKGFDGRGNYNFGITEQIVFPEINYDRVNSIRGMNVTIVTTAHNDFEAYELLVSLGFPINEYKKNIKLTETNSTQSETVKQTKEAVGSTNDNKVEVDDSDVKSENIVEEKSISKDINIENIDESDNSNDEDVTSNEEDNK